MKRIILLTIIILLLAGCCTHKDPQAVLPGWSDNQLEFGDSHSVLVLVSNNKPYVFIDTVPGWYAIPSPITDVYWCN